MKELALINPENVSEEEVKIYATRKAVRAIIVDEDNNIVLLFVAKENYHKLPGGGIESSEDKKTALERECLEEIGCKIKIVDEIGSIIEYRRILELKQISYCYLAEVVGEKGQPKYTDKELEKGFKQVWFPFEEALKAIMQSDASSVEGKDYIVPRDTIFLQAAGEMLKNNF